MNDLKVNSVCIGDYLIKRLLDLGVRHVFGIPGDYVLGFDKKLSDSELEFVTTCDEQGAGFAADAYARLNGLGAVCITYCVGGLKVANTTAQAYAEKSPVVVISGSPGIKERHKNPLLHHMVKDFDTQLKVFEELTVAHAVIDDPRAACDEIDRVLSACVRYKRPVYIELPRDMVSVPIEAGRRLPEKDVASDPNALREALGEAIEIINQAAKPVIIAGVEIQRFRLKDQLVKFLEKSNIPVASTILSKSVVDECSLLYMGVYEGAMGQEAVREYVESSDCLILLGTFMTDVNLGMYTAHLDQDKTIYAKDINTVP
jgi:TPP-dependent 2-oxoacid decarboxylase